MRMLPLLVVFALLAAGIGFALAAGARPIPSERLRVGGNRELGFVQGATSLCWLTLDRRSGCHD